MGRDRKAVKVSQALDIPYRQALNLLRKARGANPEIRWEDLPAKVIADNLPAPS